MKFLLLQLILFTTFFCFGQESISFKHVSCPEKWWGLTHPFAIKKAKQISYEARDVTKLILKNKTLKGNGNGNQVDAFRHTYWMARLTQEIGSKRAKKLGIAHEKGNYNYFKKYKKEDGEIPDKISSDMDLYNNNVGIELGKKASSFELKDMVIDFILKGKCKIIKEDNFGNFLYKNNKIIPLKELKGKWINNKILVNSNK